MNNIEKLSLPYIQPPGALILLKRDMVSPLKGPGAYIVYKMGVEMLTTYCEILVQATRYQ